MKNLYSTVALAFLASTVSAQIKVNSLDLANAGDKVRVSVALTADVAQIEISGANVVWDFSDLSPSSQRLEKFDAPNTFVSPFNLLFNSSNTTYGKINATFSNLNLMVISIEKAYDFFRKTPDFYTQGGTGLTINDMSIPFLYTSRDYVHFFPVEYQDEDSSDFAFGAGLPDLGYYGQTGKRVNNADGWGKITTPYGTFDVLKITSKVDITDTIYINQFSFGTKFNRPTNFQYKWYAKTEKLPILEVHGSYQGANFIPTSVVYRDIYRPEVNQLSNEESALLGKVELFPNPTKNIINVNSPKVEMSDYRIFDVAGKVVSNGNLAFQNNAVISVENLTNGIYIFYATTSKGAIVKKFVKE